VVSFALNRIIKFKLGINTKISIYMRFMKIKIKTCIKLN